MPDREYFGFIWDEAKNETNKKKHKISFETASRVFNDPYLLTEYDDEHSNLDESRYKNIGMIDGNLVVAVWITDRDEKIRIISARKANLNEVRIYEECAKNLQLY